jgi:hypothetical protein
MSEERGWNEKENPEMEHENWVLQEPGGEKYSLPSKVSRNS